MPESRPQPARGHAPRLGPAVRGAAEADASRARPENTASGQASRLNARTNERTVVHRLRSNERAGAARVPKPAASRAALVVSEAGTAIATHGARIGSNARVDHARRQRGRASGRLSSKQRAVACRPANGTNLRRRARSIHAPRTTFARPLKASGRPLRPCRRPVLSTPTAWRYSRGRRAAGWSARLPRPSTDRLPPTPYCPRPNR
jgi:hypothetical protein